jgi:hypothetical protein
LFPLSKQAVYRDTKGRFATKRRWINAVERKDGSVKRTFVNRKKLPKPKRKEPLPEPEEFEEDQDAEYGGAFDSP